jgi:predicted ArsR family transcriptional regulator
MQVLICIAHDPARLREIGERVGITERAAYRPVTELAAA